MHLVTILKQQCSLQTLASFHPDLQKVVAQKFDNNKRSLIVTGSLVSKATEIYQTMNTPRIDFNGAMEFLRNPKMPVEIER